MTVTCPYCGAPQTAPSPADAGLQFPCPACGRKWGWNGRAAIVAAPLSDPPVVPRQTSVLPPIVIEQRRGWGIGAGFGLMLLALIAVPAEFVIGFIASLMFGTPRPAEMAAALIPLTLLVGVIGLVWGIVVSLTRR